MQPKRNRLRSSSDFSRVYKKGASVAGNNLVLYSLTNDRGQRLGLSVSKKIGGAVTRNKVKRRLRHAFAACRGDLRNDIDLVVVARKGSATADYQIMEEEMRTLMARQGLARPDRAGA